MEICRKRSGNDRRTRALRKIFEPLHEMRSSRAPRPRARSLCVVSSSPHVRQSGERSNQRQSRSARVGAGGGLPRATLAVDLVRCAHHETAFVDPQWLAELLITISFSPASYHQIRVARDPQMLFRSNSGSSPGGSPPARSRNFVETTFLNFEIH